MLRDSGHAKTRNYSLHPDSMARKRRKARTHLKGAAAQDKPESDVPKSFIIKHGQVGSSIAQLVRDVRKVMEPNTASRLRVSRNSSRLFKEKHTRLLSQERKRNKLKDFFTMGPALGVSHILAFSLTPVAPSLRIVKLSDGPTLSFRIERYSLMRDIATTSRRAKSIGLEYLTPPLVCVRI